MEFECNKEKSASNRRKHGISLDEATRLWEITHLEVEARTLDEPRWMAIGLVEGKLYACIYTVRGERIRLISCRRAREKEAQLYHVHIKKIDR